MSFFRISAIVTFICITFFHNLVFAAPSISSILGTVEDGANISISGQGFGTHSLKIEWLGGPNGNIESGKSGTVFSKSGWTVDSTSSAFQASEYSSVRAHSGEKSIKSFTTSSDQYGRGYYFDTGGPQDKIYASWWVFLDYETGGSDGQWKMFRITPTQSYSDKNGELMASAWYNATGSLSQAYTMYFCDATDYGKCYPDDPSDRWLSASDVPSEGIWQRIEVFVDGSSSANVRDGSFYMAIHKQSSAPTIAKDDSSTVITRVSESDVYRYFMFQNYFGNISTGDRTKVKMYIDDIYIQTGTKARIEIGDASTFSDCKHREIQRPTAWSNNAITFTVNKGSFTSGQTAYLYVVDSSGNVNSQGVPVTIDGTSSSTSPEDNAPTINISSPTTGSSYTTTEPVILVSGTASDDFAIDSVTFNLNGGGQMNAINDSGDWTNWSLPDLNLQPGENIVVVEATDDNQQKASNTIKATYISDGMIKIWDAKDQASYTDDWIDSTWEVCLRLLIEGNSIVQDGDQIMLGFQGRNSGDYQIKKVSIAERDPSGNDGDVIDSTWTRVTFDGNDTSTWETATTIIPSSGEKLSDSTPFNIQAGKDYYVTLIIDTPSTYIFAPSYYQELYFEGEDHTESSDWGSTNYKTYAARVHALASIYITNSDDTDGGSTIKIPVPPPGLRISMN